LIVLNIGMYFVAPVGIGLIVRRKFWKFLIQSVLLLIKSKRIKKVFIKKKKSYSV
jgi:hypothetical protein